MNGECNDLAAKFRELEVKYKHNDEPELLKQQLIDQTERHEAHVKSLIADQEFHNAKYIGLVSEKDRLIASQLKQIEETRKDNKELRKAIHEKDEETLSMEYNELKKEYDEWVKAHSGEQEKLVINYEQVINEKDEELASLNEVLQELRKKQSSKPTKLTRPDATEDSFRTKPRGGSARNIDINNYKCENPDCDSIGVETIRCNICSTFVCEDCHNVPVSKVKTIYNKCRTVYFLCKNCDQADPTTDNRSIMITNETAAPVEAGGNTSTETDNPEISRTTVNCGAATEKVGHMMKSIQEMFEKRIIQLEIKFESKFDAIVEEKIAATQVVPMYSQTVKEPVDLRKIILDQKNEEKVEDAEREKRRKNFIIHGLEEKGETLEDIKKNDEELISQFLIKVGINKNPVSITRLGKPNEKNKRTMKIVMASSDDKDFIMGNLKHLKGSEYFGKT